MPFFFLIITMYKIIVHSLTTSWKYLRKVLPRTSNDAPMRVLGWKSPVNCAGVIDRHRWQIPAEGMKRRELELVKDIQHEVCRTKEIWLLLWGFLVTCLEAFSSEFSSFCSSLCYLTSHLRPPWRQVVFGFWKNITENKFPKQVSVGVTWAK